MASPSQDGAQQDFSSRRRHRHGALRDVGTLCRTRRMIDDRHPEAQQVIELADLFSAARAARCGGCSRAMEQRRRGEEPRRGERHGRRQPGWRASARSRPDEQAFQTRSLVELRQKVAEKDAMPAPVRVVDGAAVVHSRRRSVWRGRHPIDTDDRGVLLPPRLRGAHARERYADRVHPPRPPHPPVPQHDGVGAGADTAGARDETRARGS